MLEFNRKLYLKRRVLSAPCFKQANFLHHLAADEVLFRITTSKLAPQAQILDLGSRDGYLLRQLVKAGYDPKNLFFTEISKFFVEKNPGIHLNCDENFLPTEIKEFDLITSVFNLQVMRELETFFHVVNHICKNKFIFALPSKNSLIELDKLWLDLGQKIGCQKLYTPTNLLYSADEITGKMQHAGFKSIITNNETVNLDYSTLAKLFLDLKYSGETNSLKQKNFFLGKKFYKALKKVIHNPITTSIEIIYCEAESG